MNSIRNAMAVIHAFGDDGKLGFRKVAAKIGFGETVTRYALQAYRTECLRKAVDRDVIQDGIVVAVLKHLPPNAVAHVVRIEAKLDRTLSRTRAELLVNAWKSVQARKVFKIKVRRQEPSHRGVSMVPMAVRRAAAGMH